MFSWLIGVDVGGTFTDLVAVETASGRTVHLKVPTTPRDPSDGFLAALEELRTGEPGVFDGAQLLLLHGTTLATNAILEGKLARTGLVTTAGFRDVLEIGRHLRPELYDLFIDKAPPLVPRQWRREVVERVGPDGAVETPLDAESVRGAIATLAAASVEAVAVAFLNSYRNSVHEEQVRDHLRAAKSWYVCASADLNPEVREYERMSTTVLNAALMPRVNRYADALERQLAQRAPTAQLFIMQSNGGAATVETVRARPVSLALSGPVAGVNACVYLAAQTGMPNLIGLDVGGTSADICIVEDSQPRVTTEMKIAEYPIRLPMIQVSSIGAGGGSIAWMDRGGALRVGPQSAGADPGPACYGQGGTEPTVTDAHLTLGRLDPNYFLGGRYKLDADRSREVIARRIAEPLGLDLAGAAAGIVRVVEANMERALRVSLSERGNDPRDFALVSFGGAGGLHAASLAQHLEIPRVLVPPHPGTLSAFGLLVGDVRHDFAASELLLAGDPAASTRLAAIYTALEEQARAALAADGFGPDDGFIQRSCDVRYTGQAYEVTVPCPDGATDAAGLAEILACFHREHERLYAHSDPAQPCELMTYRVAVVGRLQKPAVPEGKQQAGAPQPYAERPVAFDGTGFVPTGIFRREALAPGHVLTGPAIVDQMDATTLVPPGVRCRVDRYGNLILEMESS
ncbi:MAG: hydantoinase/oxoprolinase family protein [Chloroflexi bacterium]|nr:hydantoinase/oxoprolinase family protein [Chloroflexota bacterium]